MCAQLLCRVMDARWSFFFFGSVCCWCPSINNSHVCPSVNYAHLMIWRVLSSSGNVLLLILLCDAQSYL
jgi:hypothetical protein